MANFIPSYQGLKIDLQSASKEDLLKEARRLSSNVKRRVEKFNKLDIKTHEIDVLETRRNEILGNNYKNNITTISKNFTEGQLRATISAYDKYLKSKYATIQKVKDDANKLAINLLRKEGVEENNIEKELKKLTTKDRTELLRRVLNNRESTNKVMEFFNSPVLKEFWKEVREQNEKDDTFLQKVYDDLDSLYRSKDISDNISIKELENIIGKKLR